MFYSPKDKHNDDNLLLIFCEYHSLHVWLFVANSIQILVFDIVGLVNEFLSFSCTDFAICSLSLSFIFPDPLATASSISGDRCGDADIYEPGDMPDFKVLKVLRIDYSFLYQGW